MKRAIPLQIKAPSQPHNIRAYTLCFIFLCPNAFNNPYKCAPILWSCKSKNKWGFDEWMLNELILSCEEILNMDTLLGCFFKPKPVKQENLVCLHLWIKLLHLYFQVKEIYNLDFYFRAFGVFPNKVVPGEVLYQVGSPWVTCKKAV